MPTALNAADLTLNEVYRLLPLVRADEPMQLADRVSLEPLTTQEIQELQQIAHDFEAYRSMGNVLEGQVQCLVLAPLLRLAGFYRAPMYLSLEQGIAAIAKTSFLSLK